MLFIRDSDPVVFSGSSNRQLAKEICQHLGIPLGEVLLTRFSNDNLFVQILQSVRERDVFVVQSFSPPVSDHILEMLIMLDALKSASAGRVTAVIPYFSYARSDKKDHPRISITGRLIADLLVTAGADRVLTMTLHSPQVHGFFRVPLDHLSAVPVISEYLQELGLKNCVAVAPDAGSARRAGAFAQRLGIPMAFIDKRRLDDKTVRSSTVVGDVAGKTAIIFDDEIAAATSMVNAVQAVLQCGARDVYTCATHGVFCGPAVQRIKDSPVKRVVVTNTIAHKEKLCEKIVTLSVAPLFAEAIKRIHTGESVGALFR
ncbi:MAG: ribose-phosphate diphosphokinase [Armatimonadota bacterium]